MGNLVAGKIYVINAAPPGDDPETYAGTEGAEGTGHVVCDIPRFFVDQCKNGAKGKVLPGGTSFVIAFGAYSNTLRIQGVIAEGSVSANETAKGNWKKFFEAEKEDDSLYLVIKWDTDVFTLFQEGSTQRKYSQGIFYDTPGLLFSWDESTPIKYEVTFGWFQSF